MVLLYLPATAQAHLVSTGVGPFYDGVAHLFVSMQDLLLCIGMGLLAGLSGKATARSMLLFAAAAWFVGAMIGLQGIAVTWTFAAPAMLLGIGVLVALDARLPATLTVGMATAVAVVSGNLNGSALATIGITGILGAYAAFFVVALFIATAVTHFQALWVQIAVRVAGSWVGAVGLLLLGWSIRPVLA